MKELVKFTIQYHLMDSMIQLLADWRMASEGILKLVDQLPKVIGHEAVVVVKKNFDLQGYDVGTGVKPWEPRKESTNTRYRKRAGVKGTVFQADRKILEQTMNLYNSIKYYPGVRSVMIGVNISFIPYAKIHNEGGPGMAFGKYAFEMPKRQYMPLPDELPNPLIMKAAGDKIRCM